MAQKIPYGQPRLPGFERLKAGSRQLLIFHCLRHERLSEELRDFCVKTHLAVREKLLQCVVDREHFRHRGEVIERVRCDGSAVRIRRPVRQVGVGPSPGVFIHQSSVPDHGQLGARKPVLNVRLYDIGNERKRLFPDPLFHRRSLMNDRIRLLLISAHT